jgi:hypothetical protein
VIAKCLEEIFFNITWMTQFVNGMKIEKLIFPALFNCANHGPGAILPSQLGNAHR